MKILAIDIGDHSVKLVEMESLFGRIEIKNYVSMRTRDSQLESVSTKSQATKEHSSEESAENPSKETSRSILSNQQIATLKQLILSRSETLGKRYDKIVVSVPRNLVTSRLLTFPTKDRKLISKSIEFELEDELPTEIDSVVFDFAILQTQQNQSNVLVSAVMKQDMVTLLNELQELGIDPDYVTTESWAMGQLLARSMPNELIGAPVCVVNMGSSHTAFHVLVAERPVLSHVSPVGGDDITRTIAANYGISFEQAETSKTEGAFLITNSQLDQFMDPSSSEEADHITEDQKKFAKIIADSLAPLIREMRQTLMSFKSQYQMMPKALLITGGGSLIPNMAAFLEEHLQIPVAPLRYSSQLTHGAVELAESTECIYAAAIGLALTALKSDRGPALNLRKNEFAKKSGIASVTFSAFKRPIKYAAASLIFIYANLFVQYLVLSNRAKNQEESLERAMKAVLGPLSRSAINTYLSSPTTLRSAINREISKYKVTQAEPEKKNTSATLVLNKISRATPKDIKLDVSQLSLGSGSMVMSGLVDRETDVDLLAKSLTDAKVISAIEKGKTELDPQSRRYRFKLSGKIEEAPDVQAR